MCINILDDIYLYLINSTLAFNFFNFHAYKLKVAFIISNRFPTSIQNVSSYNLKIYCGVLGLDHILETRKEIRKKKNNLDRHFQNYTFLLVQATIRRYS